MAEDIKLADLTAKVKVNTAGLAAASAEARALTGHPVRALDGGNAAWLTCGHALTADDPRMADEAIDVWLKPYERASDRAAAMREYLSWEIDLPGRIARDGSANFVRFPA